MHISNATLKGIEGKFTTERRKDPIPKLEGIATYNVMRKKVKILLSPDEYVCICVCVCDEDAIKLWRLVTITIAVSIDE